MDKSDIASEILEVGIVAILRMRDSEKVMPAANAILEGPPYRQSIHARCNLYVKETTVHT